jgi:plasmid replication initiation protein
LSLSKEAKESLEAFRRSVEQRAADAADAAGAQRADDAKRTEQIPLFEAVFYDVQPKDDQHTMEHPFFALGKRADKKVRTFVDAHGRKTTVTPSHTGLATIYDKDLLHFVVSHLMHAKNNDDPIAPRVRIVANDLLEFAKRGDGADSYKRLIPALDRLAGTRIKTEIETNGKVITKAFGWIDGYEVISAKNGKLYEFTVTLPPWVYNAILGDEVLSIGRDYFDLGPLERRLYELARKHLGRQSEWKIAIDKLKAKAVGENGTVKRFRFELRGVIAKGGIPGFQITLTDADLVIFTRASQALPTP